MAVIAGTTRGIFSIDGSGRSTSKCAQVLECRGVRELSAVNGRLFAGTSHGVFSTALADIHAWAADCEWRVDGLDEHAVWQIRGSTDDALYATTQPAGLFKSQDGGLSWQKIEAFTDTAEAKRWCVPVDPPQPGRARALVTDAQNPQRLWVGVEVGGIMCSDDGGQNWQLSLPGDNPDIHMMCAHPQQPDVLFVSTGYGRFDGVAEMVEGNAGVFRSDDGGKTWRYAWRGVTPRYSRPMCIDSRAPYALTVASAPHAFSSYKADGGAAAVLLRSDDMGENWYSLGDETHNPSAANFHGLVTDPDNPGGVLVGTDNGEVWRVSVGGEWQCLATELPAVLALFAA